MVSYLIYVNPNKEDNCVLILVVVEDGLVLSVIRLILMGNTNVLILVVVEDGLVLNKRALKLSVCLS